MKRRDRKSTDKSRAPGTPGPRKADASQFFARPTFQLLEPRTAFDAAAAATAADASDSDSGSSADHDAAPPADAPAEAADTSARDSAALGDALQAVPDAPASLQNAVIFIDAAVEDKGTIIANIDSSAEIVILDGTTDGVTQIADYLSGRSGIESLHIISHGEAGKVTLGSVDLTSASIDGAHSSALATIGAALADSADIMLYGCDVAASAEGEAFVSALAQATGADIGASLDPTGDFASGGDWQLEYKSGSVESGTIAADDYGGLLAPIAITNVGSSNVTAMTMAQSIAGDGVTILNATYSGANGQSGTFTGGTGYTKDWLAFDSGVVLTTGSTTGIAGSNTVGQTTTDAQSTGTGADADLAAVGAGESFDAATLSFEFIPTTNQVTLQFVFGSEEYNEYVYSTFNDAMGIWINGVNVALNPAGTPISIDTINQAGTYAPGSGSEANDPNPGNGAYDSSAPNLYINNAPGAGTYTTGMDGFTVTLSIIANVNVGVSNTIKIGVADIGDAAYDSYLFVKAGSLVGVPTANTDNAITGRDVPVVIDVLSNDLVGPDGPITITHIADKPIVAGGAAVTFASGSSVSLSTDGKLTYTPAAGKTGADLLTYTVADKSGHTSVGYIDIKVVDNAAPLLDLDTSVATPTGTVADSIVSNNYSNSTGTVAWNSSWSETGDDGAANSGDIKTVNDGSRTVLQIGGGANAIQRSADLSAYDNATLQFEYRRISFDTFTDYVDVMASSDGVTFTQVGRLSGPADDSGYATFSANISNYISANTTIRLVSSNGLGNSDFLRIDNVVVTGQTPVTGYAGTFTENGAPVAIASSAGSGVAISDFDSANISKATITITNAMASDLLSISGGLPAGITATISQAGDVITLTGSASKADYETAIEHIRFGNTSDNPSTVTRQIAVTVSDETGLVSNTAMASISVTAVNDAPVAAADTFSTAEDTPVTFDVRGNDSDVDSAALTVTAINGTAIAAGGSVAITGGNVTLNANGSLTFTPNANWNGTPSFTYTVSDGALTSNANVSGTVTAVNDAPVAAADTFTTAEDTPITFDVRSNDSDVDSASLTVTAINGTAIATGGSVAVTGGNVTLNANGTLTFTPNANWNGTPSFSYTVSDGALTSTANVSGTVTAVNDAPVAAADTFTTAEDTPITFDVRGNDSDVDSATLTVTAINGTAIATGGSVSVTGGSVTLNANGTLTFTPNANWNGTPSFTYTVSDGALTSSASVSGTVTAVNDAPVANNYSFTSLEDLVVNGDVRSTSSDVDGDTLTVTAINGTAISPGSTVAISGGSLFMNPDGTMRFTPTANISGTFSTNFTISDGNGGTATSTVTLTIIPVNDAPQGTDRTITVSEDTSHTFAASDFGFSDVNDSPANTLAAVIVSSLPSAGSLTLSGVAVTVGQSISAASIANLKWTPPANANGADFTNFTFQVRDNGGTSNGGQNTDATPNTLKFNVTAVNDAPIVANDTFSTNEDTPVTIDVLANDSDVDSANVAITAINGTAIATGGSVAITGGSVTLNANGTLTFTPDANWNGAPTFKYTVSDGAASASGEVSGVVNAVADAPVLDLDADDSGGTKGDGFEVTFVENDKPVAITDSDVTLLDIDAAGISTVTITLGSFVDGKSEQIEIGGATINVGVATTQVVTFGQDLTVSYDGKDTITVTDAKGDVMPADLVEKLLQTATYVHTSDSPTDGDRVLTISVTADKLESNLAACVIHVTSVNDAPVAAADTFTTAEDTPVTFDVRGNDSDVDSASLTVTAINGTAIATGGSVAIIGGNVTLNANGSLTFTPNANWNGTPSFTYTVSDGALTSTANVSGTVTAVNDAPVSAADSFTTAEDTPITFDVRSNDSDVDSASLTVTTINGTAIATGGSVAITGGSVTLNANGTLTFTPAANWNGTPSFTYTVSDGALTSTASVSGTVTAVDDAPTITLDANNSGGGLNNAGFETDHDALVSASFKPITDSDAFILDVDDVFVDKLTITLSNILDGNAEQLRIANTTFSLATSNSTTKTVGGTSFSIVYNSAIETFTITSAGGGAISTADVSTLIQGITYRDTSLAGTNGNRIFDFVVSDAAGNSNTGRAIATIGVPSTPPFIDLDPDNSRGTTGFGTAITFVEKSAPIAIADGDAEVFDTEDNITSLRVTVSSVPDDSAEIISIGGTAFNLAQSSSASVVVGGTTFSVSYNAGTSQFSISNAAGGAIADTDATAFVRSMTYQNTSVAPTATDRNVTFQVSDAFGASVQAVAKISVTPVNDAPIAAADSFTTAEDTPVTFDVRGNDSDVDSAALTVTAINGTAIVTGGYVAITGGSVTLNGNGSLTFTPNANWNGTPSFTYTVSDGALTSTANVSGTVSAVNDAPVAADDAFSTAEDTPVTFDVRGNDSDVDSASLTVTAINGSAIATGGSVAITGGNVTLNADGTLTFTPNANWNGTPSFTYTVSDGALTSTASVAGTVTAVNDAPIAADDTFTTAEDTPVTFDVRGNDSDVDSASLTITAINGTAIAAGGSVAITGGSVTLNADGTLTFTTAVNWNGTPSFTYTVSDGALTSTANVSGTVTVVNDAPIAAADSFTTAEDTAITFDVRGNDGDVDSAALTVTAINGTAIASGGSVAITGGSVTLNANGTLTFTPNANWNGTPSFTYTVSDGALTSTANVSGTVTAVNDAPVAADDAFSTAEDTPVTFDVRGNDSDVDSASLTVTAINGTAIATGGSVAITGGNVTLNANGTVTFTPNANWNGTPSFAYTVSDGALTSTANVSGTVTAANDAPIAVDDAFSTAEDTPVTFDVRGNDSDVDSAALTVTAINGTAIASGGSVAITGGSVTLNANGTLTFTPNANWNGMPSFTYTVSDGALTSTANVSGTVTAVNDAPIAADDAFSTAEDTPVTFDVRGNDSDVDSAALTVTAINGTTIATGGSVAITGGNVTLNANGSLTFTPTANWNGTPSFTYTVSDGALTSTASVTGTVTAVNDAPVAAADSFTTVEDNAVTFDVRSNDSDVDSAALTVTAINGTAIATGNSVAITGGSVTLNADGTLTFTPNANWNGTPSFTYTVSDGALTSTANVSGTVTAVNDAPIAADDTFTTAEDTPVTFDVRGNDSDVDSAALTVTAINGAAIATGGSVAITGGSVTLDANGTLTFTPNANWNGTPSFTYTVSDGALTSTANVSGTVTAVNDAPVAADDAFSTAEDTPVTFDVRGNDSDVDSAALTVTAINGTAIATGNSVAITGGSITLNADGSLTFTPNSNWNGTPSFTYTVSDGALTSTANVSGTVTAVNDAPVAADDTFTTAEDTQVTFDVRGNDSDVDSAALTVTAINGTAISTGGSVAITGGSVTLNANGTLTFTPNANWNGTPSFTYTVSDGALTSTANVSGTVTAVNDAPVAAADTFSTAEDTPVTFDVRGNDSDVDSASLTVTAINGTAIAAGGSVTITGGSVTLNANGTLTFTPAANWNGTPSFTYTVSDGALTSTANVSGTVTAVNDAPVAAADTFSTSEDAPVTFDVRGNDSDVDSAALTVTAINGTAIATGNSVAITGGNVTLNADGTLTFTPNANWNGTPSFTYTVSDGALTSTASVSGTVTAVNDLTPQPVSPTQPVLPTQPASPIATPQIEMPEKTPLKPADEIQGDFLSVDGIIRHTVEELADLNSLSDGLKTTGIIVHTVNRIAYLGGSTTLDDDGPVVRSLSDGRSNLLDRQLFQTPGPIIEEAMSWSGNSLKMPIGSAIGGGPDGPQMIIETIVRNSELFVDVSHAGMTDRGLEFRVTLHDGAPIPAWLSMTSNGTLTGRPPADVETIKLRIHAVTDDGHSVARDIEVNTNSGRFAMLEQRQSSAAPHLFSDDLDEFTMITPDDILDLASAMPPSSEAAARAP